MTGKTPDSEERTMRRKAVSEALPGFAPSLDVERYLPMTDSLDIEEEQKREFIETLWEIMVTIADLGLGIDPVQILLGNTGDCASEAGADLIECKPSQTSNRERTADPERAAEREES